MSSRATASSSSRLPAAGVRRAEIADTLANLVRAKQVQLSDGDLVHRALGAFRAGRGDFDDYVIRERARAAGCASIATFEKQLWAEAGASILHAILHDLASSAIEAADETLAAVLVASTLLGVAEIFLGAAYIFVC